MLNEILFYHFLYLISKYDEAYLVHFSFMLSLLNKKIYFFLIGGGGGALSLLVCLFREILLNQSILNKILWYVLVM